MAARWKQAKGYDPNVVLKRLRESVVRAPDGKVSFTGFDFTPLIAVLTTMLEVGRLPETETQRIVTKAIFNAARADALTANGVLSEVDLLVGMYYKQPSNKYHLITSLSFSWRAKPASFSVNKSNIRFSAAFRRYSDSRKEASEEVEHALLADMPTDYAPVLVTTEGRTSEEAVERGLAVLELVRAIWNFWLNSAHQFRISTGRRQPVNEIHLGPLHTLHKPTGASVGDEWWYEPDYTGAVRPFNSPDKLTKLLTFQRKVSRLLRNHPYRELLESSLIRYSRALDLRDWESCFLRLWAVLEQLTNTGTEGYGVTVRRASALYKAADLARQELLHLRDRRNRSVHEGKEHRDMETLMYQLKGFVEQLLWFHLNSASRFTSIQETAMFLDLPTSNAELSKHSRTIRYALRLRPN
jgi:hypothetical protein